MRTWLLFPTVSAPMPFQLALDEILFRRMEAKRTDPVLRFYFSSEPWISIGYSQQAGLPDGACLPDRQGQVRAGSDGQVRVEAFLEGGEQTEESATRIETEKRRGVSGRVFSGDRSSKTHLEQSRYQLPIAGETLRAEACLSARQARAHGTGSNGTPVIRRITGGGRVEHGHDVMFSLVATKSDDESFSSVRMSYLKIHEAVKFALEGLGARPRFFRCDEKLPKGEDCFRYPIATDLALGGKKVAGGGQRRSGAALLHQESILPIKGVEMEGLMLAIRSGLETVFEIKLQRECWNPEIFQTAARLAREKYASKAHLSS